MNVVIEVTDAPDQGPVFTNAPLTIVVVENAPKVGRAFQQLTTQDLINFLSLGMILCLSHARGRPCTCHRRPCCGNAPKPSVVLEQLAIRGSHSICFVP